MGDDLPMDFNRVIPMPVCLRDHEPTCSAVAAAKGERLYRHERPDPVAVQRCKDNLEETGYAYWYDWACANWGTKWNAYSQSEEGGAIVFWTAWSSPEPVIKRLSELFPEVAISVSYADEDIGHNCGSYTIKAGEVTEHPLPDEGEPRDRWCLTVCGRDADEYFEEREADG